jgi:hypothetical protein
MFLPNIGKIISSPFKLKYLNKKCSLSQIKKTQLSYCEYRVYILTCFLSHIEKIRYLSSIYILNFDMR